jgi:hypothetical protein
VKQLARGHQQASSSTSNVHTEQGCHVWQHAVLENPGRRCIRHLHPLTAIHCAIEIVGKLLPCCSRGSMSMYHVVAALGLCSVMLAARSQHCMWPLVGILLLRLQRVLHTFLAVCGTGNQQYSNALSWCRSVTSLPKLGRAAAGSEQVHASKERIAVHIRFGTALVATCKA